jgi:hypothetical protein
VVELVLVDAAGAVVPVECVVPPLEPFAALEVLVTPVAPPDECELPWYALEITGVTPELREPEPATANVLGARKTGTGEECGAIAVGLPVLGAPTPVEVPRGEYASVLTGRIGPRDVTITPDEPSAATLGALVCTKVDAGPEAIFTGLAPGTIPRGPATITPFDPLPANTTRTGVVGVIGANLTFVGFTGVGAVGVQPT